MESRSCSNMSTSELWMEVGRPLIGGGGGGGGGFTPINDPKRSSISGRMKRSVVLVLRLG